MDLGVPGGLPFRLRTAERLLPGGSACRSRADGGQRAHGDGNDRRWGVRAAVRGVSDGFVSHGNGVDGWAHVRGRRHARVPVLVCDGSFPIEIGRVAGFGGYGGAFGFDRIIDDVRAGLHGWDGACLENPRSRGRRTRRPACRTCAADSVVDEKDAFIERMRDFGRHAFAHAESVRYTIGEPEHKGANHVRNRRIHRNAPRQGHPDRRSVATRIPRL